jgi:hypothetical protein
MKRLLLGCMLALVLSIVPLTVWGSVEVIDESGKTTLEEGYGVYASSSFYGLFGGWSGQAPLIIICGKDKARIFEIRIESPSKLAPGYSALPEECYSWIVISSSLVTAKAGETVRVPVTITIPNDVLYINRHDQIAFYVNDITQTGFNQIAYKSSWFLTSDPYIPWVTESGISLTFIIAVAIAAIGGGCGVYLFMRRRKKNAKA